MNISQIPRILKLIKKQIKRFFQEPEDRPFRIGSITGIWVVSIRHKSIVNVNIKSKFYDSGGV